MCIRDRINGRALEMAASIREQATGLAQVNLAVNEMDRTTHQNSAMVEEATRASHDLSTQAAELNTPVSYTHLRAHETVLDPVCRLLLEKQNSSRTRTHRTHASYTSGHHQRISSYQPQPQYIAIN